MSKAKMDIGAWKVRSVPVDRWNTVGRESLPRPPRHARYLYFAQVDGKQGPVKVGITENPTTRLGAIQTSNPGLVQLRLVVEVECPTHLQLGWVEQVLHREWEPWHLRGEWYQGVAITRLWNRNCRLNGAEQIWAILQRYKDQPLYSYYRQEPHTKEVKKKISVSIRRMHQERCQGH